ncbi:AAA family ATPase [Myxococcus qinghaiensis]|uniref:AAA family ATPase n=1 Tax=Myxococcus qinghaiensis TaxID=2906758 RepID=UPI0020A76F50|nr:AAA family ATPase [Myxococcus qinghaiensis]MCP3167833.1 AAA family ATPase [Myxococcus qinghaiensis]
MIRNAEQLPEEQAPELQMLGGSASLDLIHRGRRHRVYRSRPDDRGIIVKMTAAEIPAADAIASLQHEYELLRAVDLPGVVKVLELARTRDGLALVVEDAGEQDLAERIKATPLSIGEFLEIALQVAEALVRLHEARIVHRDINPSNIVWDAEKRRATLVDLGMATTLSGLTVESASPTHLQGTLPYISPEQTGRTGRSVDARTDFYSLGATFYEMLSGSPPFTAQEPIELVHAHMARRPRPPHEVNAEVPLVLSRIVLKLLEKEPEQRYQTAEALAVDLREAKNQWAKTGTLVPFPLAYHDVPRELSIPDRLYGREKERQALREAFVQVCEGRRELVLVTGAPGIGKSALVSHLEGPVTERRGFFIAGKFDQLQRGVPYAGLTQAFRMLVRQLLMESEPALALWRERLQAAVAPNGKVLVEVIPEVQGIIGPQPPVLELGPVESRNRFNLVFTSFLRVFARPEHPFVLFMDDLQWVDGASLQLLEQWMGDVENRYLLLLGAYRDSEVGPEHPLARSLLEMREAGMRMEEIRLGPIAREDVARLIADALKQEVTRARPLADLVTQKTAGNPFFVRRLLHAFHAEKWIRFSPQKRSWEWDLPRLEQAPLSDNVLDLMVQAIHRLPEETRMLLEAGACIGHRFDLGQLAEVTGRSRTEATRQLWPALEDGLLVPLGEAYKVPRREGPMDESLGDLPGVVQFVHDRVQQAAYSLLDEERRPALHLDIGRRLLRGASNGQFDERLFDIVDQLDLGERLVRDPAEHLRLAELNLLAGRKAKASAAYQAAFHYLTVGRRHLPDEAWERHAELTFGLHRELAECAYLTGQHAAAEELVREAMEHAPSKSVQLELYCLRALAATDTGDYARALQVGREGLCLFGLEWPRERLPEAIEAEAAAVMENVGDRRIEDLARQPEVADGETRVCMRLLSIMGAPAYFSSDAQVLQFVVMRLVNLSLLRGPSAYSAYGYTFYAALHNARTGDYETGHAFGRLALALARRFGNRAEESRTLQVFGLIVNPWKAPLRGNVALFKDGYRAGVESGELQYAAYNLVALLINDFSLGIALPDFLKDVEASFEFSTKHKNKTMLEFTLAFRQGVRNLTGRTRTPVSFDDDDFQEVRFLDEAKDNRTAVAFYHVVRLQAAYLLGEYGMARERSRTAEEVLASAMGMAIESEHVFYTALTLAAVYERASEEERPALMTELEALKARLTTWARHCPENFRPKEQLVEAELARLRGDFWQAQRRYTEAIESAAREGFTQIEALANELRGRFALAHGEPRVASLYLRAARENHVRWGASVKARALEEAHPELVVSQEKPGSQSQSSSRELALDTLGLIKASQAISVETAPARLFERILRIVMEVAGAQKGGLLLGEPGALKVRAGFQAEDAEVSLLEVPLAQASEFPRSIARYVARLGESLVLADAAAEGQFATDAEVRALGIRSVACVPLKKQAKVVGVLYLENNAMAGAFTQERVEVVQVLAAQAVISLDSSTFLLERERSEHTARFLAAAGAALVESLDYATTLARVVQLAVPRFADWCLLDLVAEDGSPSRVEIAHADPAQAELAGRLKRFTAMPGGNRRHPPPKALVESQPVLLEDVSEAWMRAMALDEEHHRVLLDMRPRSVISVPLVARGRTLGILTFIVAQSGRRYDHADLAVAQDLAKRCALAMDNAALYRDAQDAIRLRDEFLSIASHELKTPLTPLQLQLHTLERRLPKLVTSEEGAAWLSERLGILRRQGMRLERLINELLDVSRISGGRLRLELERVDLSEVVAQIVTSFEDSGDLARSGSQVTASIGTPVMGWWDRLRLEQVITILLSNALKYGAGKPVNLSVSLNEFSAAVEVTDQGLGIEPQHQERIFGRFERAVSARQYGGLGLGLYIASQIVERMGGAIQVSSEPGKGSVFTVTLPLAGPDSSAAEGQGHA